MNKGEYFEIISFVCTESKYQKLKIWMEFELPGELYGSQLSQPNTAQLAYVQTCLHANSLMLW